EDRLGALDATGGTAIHLAVAVAVPEQHGEDRPPGVGSLHQDVLADRHRDERLAAAPDRNVSERPADVVLGLVVNFTVRIARVPVVDTRIKRLVARMDPEVLRECDSNHPGY